MSLSFIENKDIGKLSYIKLEINESQVCEYVNVPLPYGLLISFNNNTDKYIERINSEKEIEASRLSKQHRVQKSYQNGSGFAIFSFQYSSDWI